MEPLGRNDPKPANSHRPILAAIVLFDLFYYAYRYVLRTNNARSSGSYRDTPMFLQVLDDAVVIALLIVVLVIKLKKGSLRLNRAHLLLAGIVVFCFARILLDGVLPAIYKVKGVFIYSFLVAITSAEDVRWLLQICLARQARLFLLLLLVNLAQLGLFLGTGRTPALAWTSSPAALPGPGVRFGSLWDDPNSYSLFRFFSIACVWFLERRPGPKLLLSALAVSQMLLAWSRTGFLLLVVFVLSALFMGMAGSIVRGSYLRGTVRLLGLSAGLVLVGLAAGPVFDWVMEAESSRTHLRHALMSGMQVSLVNLSAYRLPHSESVLSYVAANCGALFAALLLATFLAPLLLFFRYDRLSSADRALLQIFLLMGLSLLAVPFFWLAPLGLFYFVVAAYFFDRLAGREGVVAERDGAGPVPAAVRGA